MASPEYFVGQKLWFLRQHFTAIEYHNHDSGLPIWYAAHSGYYVNGSKDIVCISQEPYSYTDRESLIIFRPAKQVFATLEEAEEEARKMNDQSPLTPIKLVKPKKAKAKPKAKPKAKKKTKKTYKHWSDDPKENGIA